MSRAAALCQSADARTGLSGWGNREFLPRLERWLQAIAADSGLNELGRAQAEAMTLLHACNRLRLEALIAANPSILSIDLPPPVIVTGLPRSGTTAVARAIGERQGLRFLEYWEALEPFSGTVAERRTRARRMRDAALLGVPGLPALHACDEDAFADDTELQALAFGSYALEWHAHVPAWRDHYLATDQRPVYRYLERALKALTFLRGPSRWVLKSPQHMEQLPAIRSVFPGARLVVVRRDERAALRSMARVMDALQPMRRRPYPCLYWRSRFEVMSERFQYTRHLFPDLTEGTADELIHGAAQTYST